MASERSSLQESSPRSALAQGEKSADCLRLVCGSHWNRGYGALAVHYAVGFHSTYEANLALRHFEEEVIP